MNRRNLILSGTHLAAATAGFAAGIYTLPILTAPEAPTAADVAHVSSDVMFRGRFVRDLADSDALHWGEGEVSISATTVTLLGRLAPGPDYWLYLS